MTRFLLCFPAEGPFPGHGDRPGMSDPVILPGRAVRPKAEAETKLCQFSCHWIPPLVMIDSGFALAWGSAVGV
jgi:hypothetical protein